MSNCSINVILFNQCHIILSISFHCLINIILFYQCPLMYYRYHLFYQCPFIVLSMSYCSINVLSLYYQCHLVSYSINYTIIGYLPSASKIFDWAMAGRKMMTRQNWSVEEWWYFRLFIVLKFSNKTINNVFINEYT